MGDKLALLGGKPVRKKPFLPHKTTGPEEIKAVKKVLKSGYLSLFEADYFAEEPFSHLGGPFVQKLEKEWTDFYGTKFAISVNSATSGLYAAIGACGIGPGDEVIVSPFTMSASATCVLIYNAIPVFADIEPETFNLDPRSVEERITERTKAIVVIHLMGHPADMDPIMRIAKKHDLFVIEDCAQSPGAKYKGKYVGTFSDMGVFSLNVHKAIQTGEGGVVITDNDELATRLRLIRNHGEVVADQMGYKNLNNIMGYNYRMGEIEAAIATEQLKKLDYFNGRRIKLANYLSSKLKKIEGLTTPVVKPGCKHVYYMYAMKFDEDKIGITRDKFCKALIAEGIPVYQGYSKPLYLQELYQKRIGYGGKRCPFSCPLYHGKVSYGEGLCPVAERMHEKEFFNLDIVRHPHVKKDMDDIVTAFVKVFENLERLRA